jgi:hypothetical protein
MLEGRGRERFDSGLVPVAVDFPAISVAIAMNDFYCWDTAFDLDAQPEAHGELPGLPVEAPGAEVLGAPQPPTSWGTVKALYDDGR